MAFFETGADMSVALLLIPLSLVLLGVAVWALFWAIDQGQMDDSEKHGAMALEEDPE
jgi:cbb3-type cytochrome oxidase maturation protein